LRGDPSRIRNSDFLQKYPELQAYLQNHQTVRNELNENPDRFMSAIERHDYQEQFGPGSTKRDPDVTRRELASFDGFLDSHKQISQELRGDPARIKDQQFLQKYPDLQAYLQQHPAVREELNENPSAFMYQENRFDQRQDSGNRNDNDNRDRDANRTTDRDNRNADRDRDNGQAARNQDDDRRAQSDRDANRTTDRDNRDARDADRDNRQVARNQDDDRRTQSDRDANGDRDRDRDNRNADRDANGDRDANRDRSDARADNRDIDRNNSDRDRDRSSNRQVGREGDATRGQLASFDQFLDHHREIAEQLHRDPSLLKNQQFVQNHPALQSYLQAHQGVREEIAENPNAFMRQENSFDRREDTFGKDMDGKDGFREYLGSHSDVAKQLHKKPELANDAKFLQKHPDFQEYLKAHPAVQTQLTQDPTNFMKSMQQPSASATTTGTAKTTTPDPKPKQ
jgi:hypothetical protein